MWLFIVRRLSFEVSNKGSVFIFNDQAVQEEYLPFVEGN
jgi:hypothetical protein